MSAQDRTQIYQQIIAKCWVDEVFKASLIADPRAVLAAEGFIVPDSKTIKVVECQEDEVVFQIPFNNGELSLEDLDGVVGGLGSGLNKKAGFMGGNLPFE